MCFMSSIYILIHTQYMHFRIKKILDIFRNIRIWSTKGKSLNETDSKPETIRLNSTSNETILAPARMRIWWLWKKSCTRHYPVHFLVSSPTYQLPVKTYRTTCFSVRCSASINSYEEVILSRTDRVWWSFISEFGEKKMVLYSMIY